MIIEPAVRKQGSLANYVVGLVFLSYLAIGLVVVGHYGISWDEPFHREYGEAVVDYVFQRDSRLLDSTEKYHGPFVNVALTIAERLVALEDSRDIYRLRHRVTFVIFFAGVLAFYAVCNHLFQSWKLGLLGSMFLASHPRIFADSFYNTTDTPFLAGFVASILTLLWFVRYRTARYMVLHAIASAVLIAIRLIGVIVPGITLVVLLCRSNGSEQGTTREIGRAYVLYGTLVTAFVLLLWPTLWSNPVYHLWMALNEAARLPHVETVRYMGSDIPASALPWHYLPVWIGISTPLVPLVLAIVGAGILVVRVIRGGVQALRQEGDLVTVMWVGLPLFAVLLVRPVLYDGWRHFFFLYPGIVLLALKALQEFVRVGNRNVDKHLSSVKCWIAAVTVCFGVVSSIVAIKEYHPHQNVYFNLLVGGTKGAKGKFDLDYWGLSYRQGLEYVLQTDDSLEIPLYVAHEVGVFSRLMLAPQDRRRLRFVEDLGEARYYLTNFRWHDDEPPSGEPYYSVVVGGSEILTVKKIAFVNGL